MGQPVKLSDELVCDARVTAGVSDRSIAGQIEFWAQLGRAVDPLLRGDRVLALRRASAVRRLSSVVDGVSSPQGSRRVSDFLETRPFPHFESVADAAGLLRRTEEDGTVTLGRFVNRVFEPSE
jgi:hypothetical protein